MKENEKMKRSLMPDEYDVNWTDHEQESEPGVQLAGGLKQCVDAYPKDCYIHANA